MPPNKILSSPNPKLYPDTILVPFTAVPEELPVKKCDGPALENQSSRRP